MAKWTRLQLAAALMLGLAGPAAADQITTDTDRARVPVMTALGMRELPAQPQKIVVLDIAAADTLAALEVPIAGLPSRLYVDYLNKQQAEAAPMGTLFEPDFEAIAGLAPDLIVAGGRSSRQVEALSEIAPTIDMTIWGASHVDLALSRLRSYGALMGRSATASALEAAFLAKLEAARAAVDGRGRALIVMTNGPKVTTYGAQSRFGWLHGALNLPEAVIEQPEATALEEDTTAEAAAHGEAISFEYIAQANPDWLIVIDRANAIGQDNQAAAATLDNALVTGTEAWKKGQIIYLNSAAIYIAGGGIQSMTATLEQIRAGFAVGG
ncbi:iron ABC transporter substrate-binding protein [Phaeobacter inhibens]|uniref:siderophore ABC transporter substrate-binding protein n=1 Tax=Phaeobacter inhibens TaxID=221822 RepID=UPI002776AB09|nr:siderophore ABC transporter substrate-binding protein [Phaeobacter inhibens]GLO72594.1 iron ABC transporter substrate-binding protein [Phaeobacter inhibens]